MIFIDRVVNNECYLFCGTIKGCRTPSTLCSSLLRALVSSLQAGHSFMLHIWKPLFPFSFIVGEQLLQYLGWDKKDIFMRFHYKTFTITNIMAYTRGMIPDAESSQAIYLHRFTIAQILADYVHESFNKQYHVLAIKPLFNQAIDNISAIHLVFSLLFSVLLVICYANDIPLFMKKPQAKDS